MAREQRRAGYAAVNEFPTLSRLQLVVSHALPILQWSIQSVQNEVGVELMTAEQRKQAVQDAATRLMELAQQHMQQDGADPAWRTWDFATRASHPAGESKNYHLGTARQSIAAALDWRDSLYSALQNEIVEAVAELRRATEEYEREE